MTSIQEPTPPFTYTPLDASTRQIRLINLHSGNPADPLSCTIHKIRLSSSPNPYKTISYCWGDASLRSSCLLNGHLISIPASSACVLRQARSPSHSQDLWIDALCINQEDPRERDEQVALMREIYSLSEGNLIFLDVDLDRAASSVDLFERLWSEAALFTDDFRSMERIIGKRAASRDVLDEKDSAAFFAVVFRPWFRRVWVMQEAALAPSNTCYIGPNQHIPFLDLLRAFRWREYKYHYSTNATEIDSTAVNTALRNILTLWRYVDPSHGPYRRAQGASIADALVFARGLNSSQPRDHVFGLLGLIRYNSLPASVMKRLRPAYSRSILDVFRDATVAALLEIGGIPDLIFEEIICTHYDDEALVDSEWPSWVPRWSDARDLDVHPGRLNKWYFSASGQEPFDFTPVDDATMQVRGIVLDEVSSVTDICRARDWTRDEDSQSLISWLQDVDRIAHDIPTQAINTVLLAGLNSEGRPVTQQDLDDFQDFRQGVVDFRDDGATRMSEVFARACNNRRFFRTRKEGYIGIGPNVMQSKDKVVVVDRCRAPIVIRPLDARYHRVVGECYGHGVMNGEMVSERSEMLLLR